MKISIFTNDSNKTIVGDVFSVYSDAKVTERYKIKSNEEAMNILAVVFGIEIPKNYRTRV